MRGQTGFGVYFAHTPYENTSESVVGPQTQDRVEVSPVRADIRAVCNTQELCVYSDSKWCVDIFNNFELYKRCG